MYSSFRKDIYDLFFNYFYFLKNKTLFNYDKNPNFIQEYKDGKNLIELQLQQYGTKSPGFIFVNNIYIIDKKKNFIK